MESRLKKSLSAGGREQRSSQDLTRAAPEEKFVSSHERRKMFSNEFTQTALPEVPEIPGWHVCWLSTTNSYDTINKRVRMGYVPVQADELSDFQSYKVKAGEHVGQVSCNEMLLFKIPMEMYQRIMTELHYDLPREELQKVETRLEDLQGQRDSRGRSLVQIEGEGMGNIGRQQSNIAPVFEG